MKTERNKKKDGNKTNDSTSCNEQMIINKSSIGIKQKNTTMNFWKISSLVSPCDDS